MNGHAIDKTWSALCIWHHPFTEIDKAWPVLCIWHHPFHRDLGLSPPLVSIITAKNGTLIPFQNTHPAVFQQLPWKSMCKTRRFYFKIYMATTTTSQGAILEHANECPNLTLLSTDVSSTAQTG